MQVKVQKDNKKQLFNKLSDIDKAALCFAASVGCYSVAHSAASVAVTYMPDTAVAPKEYVEKHGYHGDILNTLDTPVVHIYDSSDNMHYKTRMQISRAQKLREEGGWQSGFRGLFQRIRIGDDMIESFFNKKGASALTPLRDHYNYVMRKPQQCLISIDRYGSIAAYVADISFMPIRPDVFGTLEGNKDVLKYLNEHVLGHEFAHCNGGGSAGIPEELRVETISYRHIKDSYSDQESVIALRLAKASRVIGDLNGSAESHAMGHLLRDHIKNGDAEAYEASILEYSRLKSAVWQFDYKDLYADDMPHFEKTYHFFQAYVAYAIAQTPASADAAAISDIPYVDMMVNYIQAVEIVNFYAHNQLLKYPDAYKSAKMINNMDDVEACLNYGEMKNDGKRLDCHALGL